MKTTGYICFAASLGGLLFGFDTAVISGTLKFVTVQFHMNTIMEGWFVSSGLLGCIIGVLLAGMLSDRIGRKKVLLCSSVLFLAACLGCAFSGSVSMLICFRLISGTGVGIASVVSPMYISEMASSHFRGRMVAFYQLAITFGILLAYFSNSLLLSFAETNHGSLFYLSDDIEVWRVMFLMGIFPALLFMALIFTIPESPRWLAEKALDKPVLEIGERPSIFNKNIRLPLIIGITLAILQQFSGINAIIYYGPKIFEIAGLTSGNALYAQVIIGLINVLFTVVAVMLSDKFGRKPLLLTGLTGMVLSLLTVGFCFYTGNANGMLLLAVLLIFIACFAFSVGPVTWIIINEIFPNNVRAKAVSLCTFALWFAVWLVGQFFPWLLKNLGAAGVFWVFAVFSIINLIFCFKVLVETKGRSLEEMEELFVKA